MQIFLVAVWTDWVICRCISGDKASLSPLEDSTSRMFLCRAEELTDSAIEERISVKRVNAVIMEVVVLDRDR